MPNEQLMALDGIAGEPGVAKPDPILVADKVHKAFGGLTAVSVDHLEIQRGAITGLIGPNGPQDHLFNLSPSSTVPTREPGEFEGHSLAASPRTRSPAGDGAHLPAHQGPSRLTVRRT